MGKKSSMTHLLRSQVQLQCQVLSGHYAVSAVLCRAVLALFTIGQRSGKYGFCNVNISAADGGGWGCAIMSAWMCTFSSPYPPTHLQHQPSALTSKLISLTWHNNLLAGGFAFCKETSWKMES